MKRDLKQEKARRQRLYDKKQLTITKLEKDAHIIKDPRKNSLIKMGIIIGVPIIFLIIYYILKPSKGLFGNSSYILNGLNIYFILVLLLSLIWLTTLLGMYEKSMMKWYNYRNLKLSERYNLQIKQLNLKEWKQREQSKNHLGLWISIIFSLLGFILTLIFIL